MQTLEGHTENLFFFWVLILLTYLYPYKISVNNCTYKYATLERSSEKTDLLVQLLKLFSLKNIIPQYLFYFQTFNPHSKRLLLGENVMLGGSKSFRGCVLNSHCIFSNYFL